MICAAELTHNAHDVDVARWDFQVVDANLTCTVNADHDVVAKVVNCVVAAITLEAARFYKANLAKLHENCFVAFTDVRNSRALGCRLFALDWYDGKTQTRSTKLRETSARRACCLTELRKGGIFDND